MDFGVAVILAFATWVGWLIGWPIARFITRTIGVDVRGSEKMKWLISQLILKPLIKRNYTLRAKGLLPDEWYWADTIAYRWGHTIPARSPGNRH